MKNLLLPAVAALAAILILPGWSFYFDVAPKVVVVIAAAGLALLFVRRWPRSARFQWFFRIALLQAAALLLATIFSTHRWFSFYGSTWRRSGMVAGLAVLILGVTGAAQLRDLRGWLRITVLASIPIAAYAILQYFGIDPILAPGGYHFGEGTYMIVRPPATLGHAAYLATYLLYVIFAGAELVRLESSGMWKTAAAAASGLAFFAMVLSGTRAALLGLVAGAIFVALRDRLNRQTLYAGAALVAMVAVFYASPSGERLRARAFWSGEDPLGGARLLLWRDTLRMSGGRWAAGYGPETFSMEFPRHESIDLARAYPDFYHESPHNIFLDSLVSEGLPGLIALVALVAFGLAIARGFMGAALVAMLVSQQFTTFTLTTELFLFLALAILVADPKAPEGTVPARPLRAVFALAFIAFAIYVASGDALLASARRAIGQGRLDRAAEQVDLARRWGAGADLYFSRQFAAAPSRNPVERLRAWRYGFTAAAHAGETADDPQNALVNLAAFQANLNDAAAVEQSLRRAIALAPNWFKPHWLLAQVWEQQGRMEEARAEARLATERDGGKHPEVAATEKRLRTR